MILLNKADLKDQEGMERALQSYFHWMQQEGDGTFNAMLGGEFVSCDFEKKTILIAMETKPWMANPSQIVHGGITASILDFTMGILARYCTTGCMTPTISMNVEYLRPMPLNSRILVEATMTMVGFSLCHVSSRCWAEDTPEKLIAAGTGTYHVTRRPD